MGSEMCIRDRIVAILSWQLHLSTQQFTLNFQRTVDVITLRCRDDSLAIDVNVMSILFYLNRTDGQVTDLEGREIHLTKSGPNATFVIDRELEGYYSCGMNDHVGSRAISLICKLGLILYELEIISFFDRYIVSSSDGYPANKHKNELCSAVYRLSLIHI